MQYQTFDDQSEETVFQLQQVIRELDEIASLIEHECEETEAKKSFNVLEAKSWSTKTLAVLVSPLP